MSQTHKELEQQIVVWVLVLKAHRTLFLQMDSIDERDSAFVPVGFQVVSLRHPGGATKKTVFDYFSLRSCFQFVLHLTHLLQVSLLSPWGLFSREVARLLNPAGIESHWSKRMPLPREKLPAAHCVHSWADISRNSPALHENAGGQRAGRKTNFTFPKPLDIQFEKSFMEYKMKLKMTEAVMQITAAFSIMCPSDRGS